MAKPRPMKPMRVDAGPLTRSICDQLDVISIINEAVPWDRQRCKLSPGERICALIISCFLRQRPLYRVFLSFLTTDCGVLLGRGVVPADINDDALGRALDKLAVADPEKVFAAMCARAAVIETVDRRFLHWDSTSRSFYGDYDRPVADSGVAVTHGHSKDHRPDLKQIMLSVLDNREGFPLWGEVHPGNASDKKLNTEVIAQIRDAFSPEELRTLIHVALCRHWHYPEPGVRTLWYRESWPKEVGIIAVPEDAQNSTDWRRFVVVQGVRAPATALRW